MLERVVRTVKFGFQITLQTLGCAALSAACLALTFCLYLYMSADHHDRADMHRSIASFTERATDSSRIEVRRSFKAKDFVEIPENTSAAFSLNEPAKASFVND